MRKLKQIVLPVLLISGAGFLTFVTSFAAVELIYQTKVNQETSDLIGIIAKKYPEVDASELLGVLQAEADVEIRENGAKILQKYGVEIDNSIVASSKFLITQSLKLSLVIIGGIGLVLAIYFYWRDWRQNDEMRKLVKYLQDLSNSLYDLKLEENEEGELSILTNELYKVTVLLREAAATNQKHSENLETALADISHQLRTPLTSLQVMVDNIYEDPEMPAEVRQDFLQSISRQLDNMSSLVTTLLNLAKFDNGAIKMHDRLVKVGEILDDVKDKLAILADLRDVRIEFTGDLTAEVELDARWQTEALANIVKNCIEHSPAGEKVKITVEDCPLFLKIMIEDAGDGMTAHDQKHIFDRFYRAQNAIAGSVGIGMSFAQAVIKADDGQISVKSKPGLGTIFTVKYFHNARR